MRVRKKLGVCYVLMVLLTIAIVIPIIWLVFISMKPNSEIMNNPLSLPNALDFGNYVSALQTLDLFTLYKNTAFIAVCSLAVEIVITFSSAVGLTRLYYRSDGVRSGLQGFLQLGLAVSPFILLFPIYKINKFLGFSQQLSLILPYIATSISFNTLLFTAYLRTVPKELDEAALMDGVSLWQLMTKILVPIAKPVLATVIIFNLLYIWNEYPFASIMIEKPAYFARHCGIPGAVQYRLWRPGRLQRHGAAAGARILRDLPAPCGRRYDRRRRQGVNPNTYAKGMLPWQHPLFVQGVSETCLCILQPQRVLSRSMSLTPSVRWYEEKLGSSIILTMISAAELAIFSVFCQTVVMDGVTISERNVPS